MENNPNVTDDISSQWERFDKTDPQDKFQMLNSWDLALPGACGACGTSDKEAKYLWFGRDFEFFGTFYLCSHCLLQAANVYGLISKGQADRLYEQLELAQETIHYKQAQINSILDSINNVRTDHRGADSNLDLGLSIEPPLVLGDVADVQIEHAGQSDPAKDDADASTGYDAETNGEGSDDVSESVSSNSDPWDI